MTRERAMQRLWCLLVGTILALAPLGASAAESLTPPEGMTAASQPMPAFDLANADGVTVRSAELQGKVMVVRFWATW
jgi:cytochrome oxidase Cu insertion factor (SCO1/SenC/PrrC family)